VRQFKLSNNPNFVDKLRDVVGLYVDPPTHAIVPRLTRKSEPVIRQVSPILQHVRRAPSRAREISARGRTQRAGHRAGPQLVDKIANPRIATWTASPVRHRDLRELALDHLALEEFLLTPKPGSQPSIDA
jgi:hypothetical protein